MSDAPVEYTCKHYSILIEDFARTLERIADVQNGLALECETAFQAYLSLALFRVVKDSAQHLETFLEAHDPAGSIKPVNLVLHTPIMGL